MDPTKESIALGRRIRQAREAAGLSQVEAATKAWGDYRRQSDWSEYESGKANPGFPTLRRIAAVLGTTVSKLTEGI